MAELRQHVLAYRPTDSHVRYLAAGLAFLVAVLHIFHPKRGFPRLAIILTLENPVQHLVYDPRPVLFVVSGITIIIGVNLMVFGIPRKPMYALGMALMAVYFIGYFMWHLSGHGGFLPGREPLYHGLHPVEAVISHLEEYAWARWTKVSEVALFAVLVVLYYREAK